VGRVAQEVRFFASPAELREWFDAHHELDKELNVGFHRRASGRQSVTWEEAVDEALSVGWIDGVRHGIDDESYRIRFTPRRRGSIWSRRNVERVAELTAQGRMRPAGTAAFEARRPERTGIYSHELPTIDLDPAYEAELRKVPAAWEYFAERPAGYRRAVTRWVMGAKREETRRRRLATLIEDSANRRLVRQFTPRRR
jgi:uncharacterized protein YdeI (YjbR/CyaY-like superfamily)